jgi:signal transduction histidine kinase
MILSDSKIIVKIGLVVGLILLMMLGLMVVEMKALNTMKNDLNAVVSVNNEKLVLAQDLRFLARNDAVLVRNILLMRDIDEIEAEMARIEDGEKRYSEARTRLESLETEAKGREILAAVKKDEAFTRDLWGKAIKLGLAGEREKGAETLLKAARERQWSWLGSLDAMVTLQKDLAVASAQKAMQEYERTRKIMVVANFLAFIVSALLVILLASSIVRPLHAFTRSVDSIAGGDFTTRISLERQDEIGTLGAHINNMAEHLQVNEKELDLYRFHLEELIEERTGDLNDQRKRFISVLIHDLKGPLVPLIGFSQKLISKKALGEEKTGEYARAIHEASMKLAATIDRISDDLRGGCLHYSFDRKIFNLGELLASVVKSYTPKAETEHLRMELEGAGIRTGETTGDEILFFGDCAKIQTLIENLIGNAVKYARAMIRVTLTRENDILVLVVEDDGAGIEEKYRERIFDEYFQIPESKDGTGVGLYSARKIVEHYKGEILVGTSSLGGAKFTVRLPASRH